MRHTGGWSSGTRMTIDGPRGAAGRTRDGGGTHVTALPNGVEFTVTRQGNRRLSPSMGEGGGGSCQRHRARSAVRSAADR